VNYAVTSSDIQNFITLITTAENFPFSEKQLTDLLAKFDAISIEKNNNKEQSKEIYKYYSELFNKFKSYIEGDLSDFNGN
jgi:hypothetical protein